MCRRTVGPKAIAQYTLRASATLRGYAGPHKSPRRRHIHHLIRRCVLGGAERVSAPTSEKPLNAKLARPRSVVPGRRGSMILPKGIIGKEELQAQQGDQKGTVEGTKDGPTPPPKLADPSFERALSQRTRAPSMHTPGHPRGKARGTKEPGGPRRGVIVGRRASYAYPYPDEQRANTPRGGERRGRWT